MVPRVTIAGAVRVPRDMLAEEEIREDWRALSCPNPWRVSAIKAGDGRAWRLPEFVSTLTETPTEILYPIGEPRVYRPRLRGKAHELVDERPTFEPAPVPYFGELLPYQAEAVEALCAHTTGLVVAPCGSGKGEILCAVVGRLGVPALVIVASLDQAAELRDRFERRLGLRAGLVGGGEATAGRVTVALVQSLDAATLGGLSRLFGVCLVDEAHHAAAESYRVALTAIQARRRYGFTATIDREDGLRAFVHHHLGPVRYEITRAQLADAGRAVEPRFVEVRTSFRYDYWDREDWAPLLDALVTDADRNALIVETAAREGRGEVSAVLTGRIEHAETIRGLLEGRGLRACALTSETRKADRAGVIKAARAGRLDVLVGTQLLDEGIDVPRLSRVFLVYPQKAEGRLVQRVGRALRPHEGKGAAVVFDFVDAHVGPLLGQARKRRDVFARQWPESWSRAA